MIEDDYVHELMDIASRIGEMHELLNKDDIDRMYEFRSRAGEALRLCTEISTLKI
ncbi:hypothetical protein [Vulcanisaeta distributa]|uniref:hypothetical protein n=1 Tax=Vulcanisaeta distributa TaxID=164451 RepID=UPI001FB4BCF4|nr:hypothetical protein [Vulcanisaeta distributa]